MLKRIVLQESFFENGNINLFDIKINFIANYKTFEKIKNKWWNILIEIFVALMNDYIKILKREDNHGRKDLMLD